MLLLIEGVDGTGKSTLAERLEAALSGFHRFDNVSLRHCGPLKQNPLDEYERDLDGYRPGFGLHVIYDRHLIGEDVYGPLYRDASAMDTAQRWHIEAYLNARGAVLVHLTHNLEVLADRHIESGEDFLKLSDLGLAAKRFQRVVSSSRILHKVELTDPTEQDEHQLTILGAWAEHDVVALAKFPTYVGRPKPKYLLLGERRGGTDPQRYEAAFVPHRDTSGHFLIDALPAHIADDVGIANACEEDVPALWLALGRPRVAVLGVEAHKALRGVDIRYGRAPHPQWVRRFAHGARQHYGGIITEALTRGLDLSGWRP